LRVVFATVAGIETRWYEAGSGPPLLLIHGGGVSADSWMRLAERLAPDFRIIAPDTLGHGFTGRGGLDGGPPQPHMVKHLRAFIDHLGLTRFAMGGSSYGAMLAMLTYFEVKDRVDRLIFFSSASTTLTDEERARSLKAAYANGSSAIGNPTLETVRARMGRIFHDPGKIPPELIVMQMTIYALPQARQNYDLVMLGMMDLEACRPWRVNDRFGEIEAPLLMLWGLDDKRVKFERAVEAAKAAREAYLVGIENCSHEPHIEHADQTAGLIRRFLKGEPLPEYRV
jgi:pimeloyl-ACP methyl ester carboxylesterase